MNASKYAWKILHARIRDNLAADEGLGLSRVVETIATLLDQADEDNIEVDRLIVALAGWGAKYALMLRRTDEDPLRVAKRMEEDIMAQPDGDDDGDN
jgi:hypothetical protein